MADDLSNAIVKAADKMQKKDIQEIPVAGTIHRSRNGKYSFLPTITCSLNRTIEYDTIEGALRLADCFGCELLLPIGEAKVLLDLYQGFYKQDPTGRKVVALLRMKSNKKRKF